MICIICAARAFLCGPLVEQDSGDRRSDDSFAGRFWPPASARRFDAPSVLRVYIYKKRWMPRRIVIL